jgi:hypothetical protein
MTKHISLDQVASDELHQPEFRMIFSSRNEAGDVSTLISQYDASVKANGVDVRKKDDESAPLGPWGAWRGL